MIKPEFFYSELRNNQIDFFSGVPDSMLKSICAFITDHTPPEKNIITANEGASVALATGYHIGTNKIPLVYMQNSGVGNAVNPILSLADKEVYGIPMLIMIGWRGEPGVKDEPQHIKQGRITPALLKSMEIPYETLDGNSDYRQILSFLSGETRKLQTPVALLVKKGAFEPYELVKGQNDGTHPYREDALKEILLNIPQNSIVVSTTGMLSRELFELRETLGQSHSTDFLTVGSMGHTTQIALGIAIAHPDKTIYCFDGDGSAIMHLGSYAIIGNLKPPNLKIILFNNGAHDSVGGQPTIGFEIDFIKLTKAFGYSFSGTVGNLKDIKSHLTKLNGRKDLSFLEIKIRKGARKDLGRPTSAPIENKVALQKFLGQ